MIIVDRKIKQLAASGTPLNIGLFGAGYAGRGIVAQIMGCMPGLHVSVICNRTVDKARRALLEAGVAADNIVEVSTISQLNRAIEQGQCAITDDVHLACASSTTPVYIEVTGQVEYGAKVTLAAIEQGKHMVLLNAELDATLGPLLNHEAQKAGTLLTGCDGDQPAAQLNLYRFLQTIGLQPLVCGNIKGLQDHYRTPETQQAYAREWGQDPQMVTSFADGTKISFEQAIVANATGMQVAQRGMIGHEFKGHVDEMTHMYDVDQLRELGGIVDYVVGASPGPGIYILAEALKPVQKQFLNYGKLGQGPLYSFYTPYHLTVLEAPLSAARAVLCDDVAIAPLAGPVVDVITTAKRDLKKGEIMDGLGGYMSYGQCENHKTVRAEKLLPMGLAEGCTLLRDIAKDEVLTLDDVKPPQDRLSWELRAKQDALFS